MSTEKHDAKIAAPHATDAEARKHDAPLDPAHLPSINEPPGSKTHAEAHAAEKKDPAEASLGVTKSKSDVSHETSVKHEDKHKRR